jgi:hypothetical protein
LFERVVYSLNYDPTEVYVLVEIDL